MASLLDVVTPPALCVTFMASLLNVVTPPAPCFVLVWDGHAKANKGGDARPQFYVEISKNGETWLFFKRWNLGLSC